MRFALPNIFKRSKSPAVVDETKSWAMEGSWRGPFYGQGELGGWYPMDPLADGWQTNLNVRGLNGRHVSAVYACVMLTARAISQCTPEHVTTSKEGADAVLKTSPVAQVLRIPNSYETWTQLILNTACELLFEGECVWYAVRDDRFQIVQVHRVNKGQWAIHIDPESHEIFYGISGNADDLAEIPEVLIPARDVAHFRQHCPRHPLSGESPISAAALAVGINVALSRSQLAFFTRMNRPSGVLTTDALLTKDQISQLRTAFDDQSKAMLAGGLPILAGGLKFQSMGVTQNDSQLIEQQRLSISEIARVFGVPMTMISETSGPQGGTEAMISHWLSIGLGSVIESIERTLDRLFELPVNQRVELNPAPLLRVDFAGRIEGLAKSVQNGILSVNEARAKEGYGPVPNGDVPALQQQMVPIDLLTQIHAAQLRAAEAPPPEPEPEAEPEDDEKSGGDPVVAKGYVLAYREEARKRA